MIERSKVKKKCGIDLSLNILNIKRAAYYIILPIYNIHNDNKNNNDIHPSSAEIYFL